MLKAANTLVVVTSLAITLWPTIALADNPPTDCIDGVGCFTRVEERGAPSRIHHGAASTAPPVQQCIDPATCNLAAAGGNPTTPAQAAQEAVSLLPLKGPQIGVAPDPNGAGLVGLPVWLWTAVTPLTWGPVEQTTAVTGMAVVTRAQATGITWDMGDGQQIVCAGPGTPYEARYGNTASPDCGYRYPRDSRTQPGGVYTITGTTSWQVAWRIAGTGQNGVIPTTTQTTTAITIQELQVVSQ